MDYFSRDISWTLKDDNYKMHFCQNHMTFIGILDLCGVGLCDLILAVGDYISMSL